MTRIPEVLYPRNPRNPRSSSTSDLNLTRFDHETILALNFIVLSFLSFPWEALNVRVLVPAAVLLLSALNTGLMNTSPLRPDHLTGLDPWVFGVPFKLIVQQTVKSGGGSLQPHATL